MDLARLVLEHRRNGDDNAKWPGADSKTAPLIASALNEALDNVCWSTNRARQSLLDILTDVILASGQKSQSPRLRQPETEIVPTIGVLISKIIKMYIHVRFTRPDDARYLMLITEEFCARETNTLWWNRFVHHLSRQYRSDVEFLIEGRHKLAICVWKCKNDVLGTTFLSDSLPFAHRGTQYRMLMNSLERNWSTASQELFVAYLKGMGLQSELLDMEHIPVFISSGISEHDLWLALLIRLAIEHKTHRSIRQSTIKNLAWYPSGDSPTNANLVNMWKFMEQTKEARISVAKLVMLCKSNVGWIPYRRDFVSKVDEFKRQLTAILVGATGNRNVSRVIAWYL